MVVSIAMGRSRESDRCLASEIGWFDVGQCHSVFPITMLLAFPTNNALDVTYQTLPIYVAVYTRKLHK